MILISKTYWAGAPWRFRQQPEDVRIESRIIRADDFRQCHGLYWTPTKRAPTTAVVVMHPRVDFMHHYCIPRLVEAGIAVLAANTRSPNNDIDTVHEEIILDVAACVKWLRKKRGIEKVILFGNSGGGSLSAFFQAQARLPPGERIATTPGGKPTRLAQAEMIPADGLVLVACHRGQGHVMSQCIDPAVTDETSALATDASLDMYDPENGFREAPEWSHYDDAFVERYRAAQQARMQRLDDHARELLAATENTDDERARSFQPVMTIYRTMANLHYTDNRLDPSPRDYGSLLSERPDLMNLQLLGFGRVLTPAAWLSTWSGLSSNADLCRNLAGITEPLFVAFAGKDREIYPLTDAEPIRRAIVSEDKTVCTYEGARHYFEPEFGEKEAPQVEVLMDDVVPWIQERFGD